MKAANTSMCCLVILYALFMGLAAGCNTMSGLGEDVQEAGDALEDAADKNKTY